MSSVIATKSEPLVGVKRSDSDTKMVSKWYW
ncbi:hypothetical protein predicted by Glimmer/Critica [Lactiplantibacillus plantarum]|nr:hypothetical protein predicted by Glimmer/Critica [Lactiplantibacillus plantarum]